MDKEKLVNLLTQLSQGSITADKVYVELEELPFKDLEFARLDTHRAMRQGFPEVIYCPGKTTEQIVAIAQALRNNHDIIIGTKCSGEQAAAIESEMTETTSKETGSKTLRETSKPHKENRGWHYYPEGKIFLWGQMPEKAQLEFKVSVITAGTADLPIAEEASLYLQAAGVLVKRQNDVGIAGLHRLIGILPQLKDSDVCIVVAGMDGALPGVVGGLLAMPVIAVPTSIGYGASFGGIAPLLTMLNSCAAGVTVVNIDNGFGAAAAALRIMQFNRK